MSRTLCPHCGRLLEAAAAPVAAPREPRQDLLELAERARRERAYDEGVKTRVTQEDIRRLLTKRRKARQ